MEPQANDTESSVLLQRNIAATLLTMRALHSLIHDGRGSVRDVDLEGNTMAHVSVNLCINLRLVTRVAQVSIRQCVLMCNRSYSTR